MTKTSNGPITVLSVLVFTLVWCVHIPTRVFAIECVVTPWSAWGSCGGVTCGIGTQTRTRNITSTPTGIQKCPSLSETRECDTGSVCYNVDMPPFSTQTHKLRTCSRIDTNGPVYYEFSYPPFVTENTTLVQGYSCYETPCVYPLTYNNRPCFNYTQGASVGTYVVADAIDEKGFFSTSRQFNVTWLVKTCSPAQVISYCGDANATGCLVRMNISGLAEGESVHSTCRPFPPTPVNATWLTCPGSWVTRHACFADERLCAWTPDIDDYDELSELMSFECPWDNYTNSTTPPEWWASTNMETCTYDESVEHCGGVVWAAATPRARPCQKKYTRFSEILGHEYEYICPSWHCDGATQIEHCGNYSHQCSQVCNKFGACVVDEADSPCELLSERPSMRCTQAQAAETCIGDEDAEDSEQVEQRCRIECDDDDLSHNCDVYVRCTGIVWELHEREFSRPFRYCTAGERERYSCSPAEADCVVDCDDFGLTDNCQMRFKCVGDHLTYLPTTRTRVMVGGTEDTSAEACGDGWLVDEARIPCLYKECDIVDASPSYYTECECDKDTCGCPSTFPNATHPCASPFTIMNCPVGSAISRQVCGAAGFDCVANCTGLAAEPQCSHPAFDSDTTCICADPATEYAPLFGLACNGRRRSCVSSEFDECGAASVGCDVVGYIFDDDDGQVVTVFADPDTQQTASYTTCECHPNATSVTEIETPTGDVALACGDTIPASTGVQPCSPSEAVTVCGTAGLSCTRVLVHTSCGVIDKATGELIEVDEEDRVACYANGVLLPRASPWFDYQWEGLTGTCACNTTASVAVRRDDSELRNGVRCPGTTAIVECSPTERDALRFPCTGVCQFSCTRSGNVLAGGNCTFDYDECYPEAALQTPIGIRAECNTSELVRVCGIGATLCEATYWWPNGTEPHPQRPVAIVGMAHDCDIDKDDIEPCTLDETAAMCPGHGLGANGSTEETQNFGGRTDRRSYYSPDRCARYIATGELVAGTCPGIIRHVRPCNSRLDVYERCHGFVDEFDASTNISCLIACSNDPYDNEGVYDSGNDTCWRVGMCVGNWETAYVTDPSVLIDVVGDAGVYVTNCTVRLIPDAYAGTRPAIIDDVETDCALLDGYATHVARQNALEEERVRDSDRLHVLYVPLHTHAQRIEHPHLRHAHHHTSVYGGVWMSHDDHADVVARDRRLAGEMDVVVHRGHVVISGSIQPMAVNTSTTIFVNSTTIYASTNPTHLLLCGAANTTLNVNVTLTTTYIVNSTGGITNSTTVARRHTNRNSCTCKPGYYLHDGSGEWNNRCRTYFRRLCTADEKQKRSSLCNGTCTVQCYHVAVAGVAGRGVEACYGFTPDESCNSGYTNDAPMNAANVRLHCGQEYGLAGTGRCKEGTQYPLPVQVCVHDPGLTKCTCIDPKVRYPRIVQYPGTNGSIESITVACGADYYTEICADDERHVYCGPNTASCTKRCRTDATGAEHCFAANECKCTSPPSLDEASLYADGTVRGRACVSRSVDGQCASYTSCGDMIVGIQSDETGADLLPTRDYFSRCGVATKAVTYTCDTSLPLDECNTETGVRCQCAPGVFSTPVRHCSAYKRACEPREIIECFAQGVCSRTRKLTHTGCSRMCAIGSTGDCTGFSDPAVDWDGRWPFTSLVAWRRLPAPVYAQGLNGTRVHARFQHPALVQLALVSTPQGNFNCTYPQTRMHCGPNGTGCLINGTNGQFIKGSCRCTGTGVYAVSARGIPTDQGHWCYSSTSTFTRPGDPVTECAPICGTIGSFGCRVVRDVHNTTLDITCLCQYILANGRYVTPVSTAKRLREAAKRLTTAQMTQLGKYVTMCLPNHEIAAEGVGLFCESLERCRYFGYTNDVISLTYMSADVARDTFRAFGTFVLDETATGYSVCNGHGKLISDNPTGLQAGACDRLPADIGEDLFDADEVNAPREHDNLMFLYGVWAEDISSRNATSDSASRDVEYAWGRNWGGYAPELYREKVWGPFAHDNEQYGRNTNERSVYAQRLYTAETERSHKVFDTSTPRGPRSARNKMASFVAITRVPAGPYPFNPWADRYWRPNGLCLLYGALTVSYIKNPTEYPLPSPSVPVPNRHVVPILTDAKTEFVYVNASGSLNNVSDSNAPKIVDYAPLDGDPKRAYTQLTDIPYTILTNRQAYDLVVGIHRTLAFCHGKEGGYEFPDVMPDPFWTFLPDARGLYPWDRPELGVGRNARETWTIIRGVCRYLNSAYDRLVKATKGAVIPDFNTDAYYFAAGLVGPIDMSVVTGGTTKNVIIYSAACLLGPTLGAPVANKYCFKSFRSVVRTGSVKISNTTTKDNGMIGVLGYTATSYKCYRMHPVDHMRPSLSRPTQCTRNKCECDSAWVGHGNGDCAVSRMENAAGGNISSLPSCKNGVRILLPDGTLGCQCFRGWALRTDGNSTVCDVSLCMNPNDNKYKDAITRHQVPMCSGKGLCVDATECRCNTGYSGTYCETSWEDNCPREFPFNGSVCSARGACIPSGTGTGAVCVCHEGSYGGYTGDACQTPVFYSHPNTASSTAPLSVSAVAIFDSATRRTSNVTYFDACPHTDTCCEATGGVMHVDRTTLDVVCKCTDPRYTGPRCDLDLCPRPEGGRGPACSNRTDYACMYITSSRLWTCVYNGTDAASLDANRYVGAALEYDLTQSCLSHGGDRMCGEPYPIGRTKCRPFWNDTTSSVYHKCVCEEGELGSKCDRNGCMGDDETTVECSGVEGATCDKSTNSSACTCPTRVRGANGKLYTGEHCEYDVTDECGSYDASSGAWNLCSEAGTCECIDGVANGTHCVGGQWGCVCEEGRGGVRCEGRCADSVCSTINACPASCGPKGMCAFNATAGIYQCACKPGTLWAINTTTGMCTVDTCASGFHSGGIFGMPLPARINPANENECICLDPTREYYHMRLCMVPTCPSTSAGYVCGTPMPGWETRIAQDCQRAAKREAARLVHVDSLLVPARRKNITEAAHYQTQIRKCNETVSTRRVCTPSMGECVCESGYTKDPRTGMCVGDCDAMGTEDVRFYAGKLTCQCKAGYGNPARGDTKCATRRCYGIDNGRIVCDGSSCACVCYEPFTGPECSIPDCNEAKGGGSYKSSTAKCACKGVWYGPSCKNHGCGKNGQPSPTNASVCLCDKGYAGSGCSTPLCPNSTTTTFVNFQIVCVCKNTDLVYNNATRNCTLPPPPPSVSTNGTSINTTTPANVACDPADPDGVIPQGTICVCSTSPLPLTPSVYTTSCVLRSIVGAPVPINDTSQTPSRCKNGGSPVGDACVCRPETTGFEGPTCETPVCSNGCTARLDSAGAIRCVQPDASSGWINDWSHPRYDCTRTRCGSNGRPTNTTHCACNRGFAFDRLKTQPVWCLEVSCPIDNLNPALPYDPESGECMCKPGYGMESCQFRVMTEQATRVRYVRARVFSSVFNDTVTAYTEATDFRFTVASTVISSDLRNTLLADQRDTSSARTVGATSVVDHILVPIQDTQQADEPVEKPPVQSEYTGAIKVAINTIVTVVVTVAVAVYTARSSTRTARISRM